VTNHKMQWRAGVGLAVAALTASLAACAESSSDGGGGAEEIPAGSTKEEYIAALADIDPITIQAQSASPKGSASGRDFDEYVASVEEWSGGKIKFEVGYSNSVVPPEQADDALIDGRLDFARVLPSYEPSEYPVSALLAQAGGAGDLSLVEGTLSSVAWIRAVSFAEEEVLNEFEDKGLKVIDPATFTGPNMMFCTEPHEDMESFKGESIAVSSAVGSLQVEALGASPVSLQFNETYEALQRGVISCTVTSVSGASNSGTAEVAPYVIYDGDTPSYVGPSAVAFSQSAWDSYPLVVQQVLWDRSVALIEGTYAKTFQDYAAVATKLKEAGGEVIPFDSASREAIAEVNEKLLAELESDPALEDGAAFVESVQTQIEEWEPIPAELGFTNGPTLLEFDEWYSDDLDLTAIVDVTYEKLFADRRPD
jgi:TRAP-type C4-dicarboxylate transport system substrate-binding protein